MAAQDGGILTEEKSDVKESDFDFEKLKDAALKLFDGHEEMMYAVMGILALFICCCCVCCLYSIIRKKKESVIYRGGNDFDSQSVISDQ